MSYLTEYTQHEKEQDLRRLRWLAMCNELNHAHLLMVFHCKRLNWKSSGTVESGFLFDLDEQDDQPLRLHTLMRKLSFQEYCEHPTLDIRVAQSHLGLPTIKAYIQLFL